MADDEPEELECGKKRELGSKADGSGVGNTLGAARTAAKTDAEENATRNALEQVTARFKCPAECPSLRIDLELSPPEITDVIPDPMDDESYSAKASCAWSCKISCRDHKIEGKDKTGEAQDLYCSDDPVIAARGTEKGTGKAGVVGNPPPADAVAKAEEAATKAAFASLLINLGLSIRMALANVRCPEKCPLKKVRIWLEKPGKPQVTAPDAQDDVHCTVTQRFQVRVECKKEE